MSYNQEYFNPDIYFPGFYISRNYFIFSVFIITLGVQIWKRYMKKVFLPIFIHNYNYMSASLLNVKFILIINHIIFCSRS